MKRKLYLFLISAALFASGSINADITSNLMLHYTFDNVTAGVAPDASGHSLDGMLMGGAVVGTGYGTTGNSVSLTNAADYVQLPNDLTTSLTDYTVACWVNLTTINYWGRIFDFGNGTATNMFMAPQNGMPYYAIKPTNEIGEQSVKANAAIVANKWTHVAVTCKFDETSGLGTLKIFIDGAPAGTKENVTTTPASMGTTLQNYIGKSQYNDPTINGLIDDFRVYSRALTTNDIMELKGVPADLITAYNALTIAGDLTAVSADLALPTPSNSAVTVSWTSTDSALVSPTGVVTRPAKYKAAASLTAILSITVNEVTTVLKKTFNLIIAPLQDASETVAIWNFASDKIAKAEDGTITVTDESDNAYVGKCAGGAQIVSIGNAELINVLSIKNSGQYFDFGLPIGEAVYGLTDYTVSIFYRRDTTADHITNWTGYGQPLYAFSNTLNMVDSAIGGMYFEPLRARQVNTPDNYGAEGSNFVGTGQNTLPLGSWHNVCYSQIDGVGHLYYDAVEVATGPMAAPAINLKRAGKTGTWYNSIGRPVYNDPWLTNTLIYGFNMYSVGLTTDDLPSILNIPQTIAALDDAFAATTYNVYSYADLAALLTSAKKAVLTNYVPGLTNFNAAIGVAQAAYDAKTPTTEGNAALTSAIAFYDSIQTPWINLGKLLPTTAAHIALNYPGLADLQTAIAAAQAIYDSYLVTPATIADLNAAILAYLKTKPASLEKPIDYTFNIVNPSFEQGAGGTLDTMSVIPGGSYNYPKGWTVYLNHDGWCNAAFISDSPSDGAKCFETWAATINEFDVYQTVDLPAGNYVMSAQVRTNALAPYTQHIYARTDAQTFVSGTLADTVIEPWNGQVNWQTLYCTFNTTGGATRIGFNANGFMQFDNMKLTYFGADVPAPVDLSSFIANASFEEGTTSGVDPTSVRPTGGSYSTPIGWNAYCNLTGNFGNMVGLNGADMSDGTKGFEMWSNGIVSFKLSQKIAAPASGFYTLTANARCDGSSPSATDTIIKYDARIYATPGIKPTKYSTKLGQQEGLITGAGWNTKEAWRTLSLNFEANVGDSIALGISSTSFMQIDNFRLIYHVNANPAVSVKTPAKASGVSLDVYPNPTSNVLNIKGLDDMSKVRVFNITGQRVFEGNSSSDNFSIDCSNYNQGMYLLQVVSNGKTVNSKFIKK